MSGRVVINPGTGPVPDATVAQAIRNVQAFVRDLKAYPVLGLSLDGSTKHRPAREDPDKVRFALRDRGAREVGRARDGRYAFVLARGDSVVELDVPGCPLDRVRYLREDQNPFEFHRLYVDGSSWLWVLALDRARERLHEPPAPRERAEAPDPATCHPTAWAIERFVADLRPEHVADREGLRGAVRSLCLSVVNAVDLDRARAADERTKRAGGLLMGARQRLGPLSIDAKTGEVYSPDGKAEEALRARLGDPELVAYVEDYLGQHGIQFLTWGVGVMLGDYGQRDPEDLERAFRSNPLVHSVVKRVQGEQRDFVLDSLARLRRMVSKVPVSCREVDEVDRALREVSDVVQGRRPYPRREPSVEDLWQEIERKRLGL